MIVGAERILPLTEPVSSLAAYLSVGGGCGLLSARRNGPDWVIDTIRAAGLRGRGGAGFPTADKWATVRGSDRGTTYAVCNAAEGEPGTFKDRFILRRNPYQVVEGLAIAAMAVGAGRAFIVIKRRFEREIAALMIAMKEMLGAGLLGAVPVQLVFGADDHLLGEATVMNNVETLAHVPEILRRGVAWFRSSGTETSPGTTVFTVSGDVRWPGVHELSLGIPLRMLIEVVAGGVPGGRRVKAVFPGASGALLTEEQLDTPCDFDSMRLGSAGFLVYDESTCIVAVTLMLSRFLAAESCVQCPACRQGIQSITECLARIDRGDGTARDMDTIAAKCGRRCALPSGEAALVRSAVAGFADDFTAHLGRPCPLPRVLPMPRITDFDEDARQFEYERCAS